MNKFQLLSFVVSLMICSCLATDGDDQTLYVGGTASNCSRSTIYEVYKDWSYYIVWNGKNFHSPCDLVFQITNTSIPFKTEQRYEICVEKDTYDLEDTKTWLSCKMYRPPFGSSDMDEKQGCSPNKKKGGNICADINEFMNITFTTLYDINATTPDEFNRSQIKLRVYAKYILPLPALLAIIFGCFAFGAIVSIVTLIACIKLVMRRHRRRVEANMNAYKYMTAQQYQAVPQHIPTSTNYTTQYGYTGYQTGPNSYQNQQPGFPTKA